MLAGSWGRLGSFMPHGLAFTSIACLACYHQARTPMVALVDVDMLISADFYQDLMNKPELRKVGARCLAGGQREALRGARRGEGSVGEKAPADSRSHLPRWAHGCSRPCRR